MEKKKDRRSSIDLLPDEAYPAVKAAREALKTRRRTQEDIREELNLKLLALGVPPVSRGAFNRYKLDLMVMGNRVLVAREVAEAFGEKLQEEPGADIGLLTGEYMKTAIYEAIADIAVDGEKFTMKDMAAASLSLMRIAAAEKMTVQTAVTKKKEFSEVVKDAVNAAVKDRGLSREVVDSILNEILGNPDDTAPK